MLRIKASELINAGTPVDDVGDALRLWLTKPKLGPHSLPSLVSEVIKARNGSHPTRPSTTDALIAQTQALKRQPTPPELLP